MEGRSAIWGGVTLGLIVGLVLGFFIGSYWHIVLRAVLIGASVGVIAEILGWVSDASRRRPPWDTSAKVLLGQALLFPDTAVSTLATKFPQLGATIRPNVDAWNLSVSVAAVGAAIIMSGERADLPEYQQFSDAALKVVQAFGGGPTLGEFLGFVKRNAAAGVEWPKAIGTWIMLNVKGDALTDQELALAEELGALLMLYFGGWFGAELGKRDQTNGVGLIIQYWLRWLAVLPGALLAGILAIFPLHWVLYATLSKFVEPYPQLPERALTPFVVGALFIWAGSRIAPQYRVESAVVLFGLWMAVLGGFVFLTASGGTWMGQRLYLQAGGLAAVMALMGGLVGLYLVRRESTSQSRVFTST